MTKFEELKREQTKYSINMMRSLCYGTVAFTLFVFMSYFINAYELPKIVEHIKYLVMGSGILSLVLMVSIYAKKKRPVDIELSKFKQKEIKSKEFEKLDKRDDLYTSYLKLFAQFDLIFYCLTPLVLNDISETLLATFTTLFAILVIVMVIAILICNYNINDLIKKRLELEIEEYNKIETERQAKKEAYKEKKQNNKKKK